MLAIAELSCMKMAAGRKKCAGEIDYKNHEISRFRDACHRVLHHFAHSAKVPRQYLLFCLLGFNSVVLFTLSARRGENFQDNVMATRAAKLNLNFHLSATRARKVVKTRGAIRRRASSLTRRSWLRWQLVYKWLTLDVVSNDMSSSTPSQMFW